MKKFGKVIMVLMAVCLVVPMLSGCGSPTSKNVSDWQQVKSPTSSLSVTLPNDWQSDPSLDSEASIAYGNDSTGQYFMVLEETKANYDDGYTLEQYANNVHDNMTDALATPTISDVSTSEAIGDGAYQFDMSGTIQNVKVHLIANFIEHGDNFYQLIGYCKAGDYTKTLVDFNNVFKSASFTD